MDAKIKKTKRTPVLSTVLKQLLDYKNLTANSLAKILEFPTPTIHRLATGEVQDPRISTLIGIVDYFNITIEQLLGRENLDNRFLPENSNQLNRPPFSIPLLTMQEASQFRQSIKRTTQWFCWQSNSDTDSEKCFSIAIKNNLYDPIFTSGAVIVVNPVIAPENGDYVVVSFEGDATPVVKRFMSEGKNKFLSSVVNEKNFVKYNPKESSILGVIIEVIMRFR
jgi:SOS-response transcriptional repressor LexA